MKKKQQKKLEIFDIITIGFFVLWIIIIVPLKAIYYIFSEGSITKDKYLKSILIKIMGIVQ